MPIKLSRQEIEDQVRDIRARRSMTVIGPMDFGPHDPFTMAASEGANKGTETSPWINPGKLSDAQRLELLRKIEGKEILSLNFWAYCFGDGGNQNNLNVNAKQIKQLAKSAKRVIAALDSHYGGSAISIAGEVNNGRADLVGAETKLALAHKITKPQAMEAVARGEWKWFSISLNADDFEFEWLNKDGEVSTDWDEIWTYRVTPVGNCWLTHNAFVGDPAWLGSQYLARAQGGALPMELSNMPGNQTPPPVAPVTVADDVAKLKTDLATSQARVTELEAALKTEKAAHFASVFDAAKAQARVKEGEREMLSYVAEGKGVEFVRAQLAARDPLVPVVTVGEAPNATPPAKASAEKRGSAEGGVPGQLSLEQEQALLNRTKPPKKKK